MVVHGNPITITHSSAVLKIRYLMFHYKLLLLDLVCMSFISISYILAFAEVMTSDDDDDDEDNILYSLLCLSEPPELCDSKNLKCFK